MRCCTRGSLIVEVDGTCGCKLWAVNRSMQSAMQIKDSRLFEEEYQSIYMINVYVNSQELLHGLWANTRMTLSPARFKDEPCKTCILAKLSSIIASRILLLQTTLSELTIVCKHSVPVFMISAQLVLIYIELECTTSPS
jgi:hypothetical protein